MKKLLALLASLLILTPAFALAEGPGPDRGPSVRAEVEVHASGDNSGRPVPAIGQLIKKEIEDAHGDIRKVASSTRDMVRGKIDAVRDIIEQHREDIQKRGDGAKEKARVRFGDRVKMLVGNISDRLASTSAKLTAIADRADARITTLEDQGHNMTQSETLLAQARADIQVAQTKILAVSAALDVTVGTTTPKAGVPAVRAAVKAAEAALGVVKQDLLKTLKSIKVEGGADAEATTTVRTQ